MIKGQCEKHGEGVNLWLCCNHVMQGEADKIVINRHDQGTAMCPECSAKVARLSSYDLCLYCEGCLRELISRLEERQGEEAVPGKNLLNEA